MQQIQAIIWDMDGVKYALDEPFLDQWRGRSIATIRKYRPGLSRDDAFAYATASFNTHQSSFDQLIADDGLDPIAGSDYFHSGIDYSHLPPAAPAYLQAMRACNVTHALLTHSNRIWARQLLSHLNILELFTRRIS